MHWQEEKKKDKVLNKIENRHSSPPTHESHLSVERIDDPRASHKTFVQNVTPFDYNYETQDQIIQRTPQPRFDSKNDINYNQSASKLFDDGTETRDTNNIIERKVEEWLRKIIGNSQMSSIPGSRESSLQRNLSLADQYLNFNQNLPQPYIKNSYNSMGAGLIHNSEIVQQDQLHSTFMQMKKQIDDLQVSLTEKDAEIIWLNMKLGDEKRSASRTTMQREMSRGTLQKDNSRNSFIELSNNRSIYESQIEMLTKDRESLVKKVKELELAKIKLETDYDSILHERDNLKLQLNYLK